MALQHRFDGLHRRLTGRYLARRRQVVVRRAFIAHRRGRHQQMPHGDGAIQHAGAATGNEFASAHADTLLQQINRQRRAHGLVQQRHFLLTHLVEIDWMIQHFAFDRVQPR